MERARADKLVRAECELACMTEARAAGEPLLGVAAAAQEERMLIMQLPRNATTQV